MPKHPVAYIVFDKDGNPWGPFTVARDASIWAETKWPGQQADLDDDEPKGWYVAVLRPPQ